VHESGQRSVPNRQAGSLGSVAANVLAYDLYALLNENIQVYALPL
jgi:hypothetical protein